MDNSATQLISDQIDQIDFRDGRFYTMMTSTALLLILLYLNVR